MLTTADIYSLIESRRLELGMSQAEVGRKAFNRNDNAAIQSLRRGSSPAFDTLSSLASALGLELYFGKPRSRPQGLAEGESPSDLGVVSALRASYLPLPWHPLARQAVATPIAPHSDWLDSSALLAENIVMVAPEETDVFGLPKRGAVCFVDTVFHDPQKDGLWCYRMAGVTHLARVAFKKDTMVILSSDPSSSPQILQREQIKDVTFLGLAVMIGFLSSNR